MNRMTDNDKTWGPFTLARWTKWFAIEFLTGDQEEEHRYRNNLRIIAFGWALRIALPNIIRPYRERHDASSWDEGTIKRLGRNWYYQTYERQFGFSLTDMGNGYDFLQIHYGRKTHDSSTDKTWSKHLPWKQWNHVRHSLYRPDGSHFYTEPPRAGRLDSKDKACWQMRDECPASYFGFEDYDGEMIVASCWVEEREWHKGCGWFKWLRFFYRPMIRRSLDLAFSEEVGPQKGSWKGGTVGTGTEMLPGDTPETAFRRYCEKEHERKGKKFHIRFIGPCAAPPPKPKHESKGEMAAKIA
jgi:hypothetical protein